MAYASDLSKPLKLMNGAGLPANGEFLEVRLLGPLSELLSVSFLLQQPRAGNLRPPLGQIITIRLPLNRLGWEPRTEPFFCDLGVWVVVALGREDSGENFR